MISDTEVVSCATVKTVSTGLQSSVLDSGCDFRH